MARTTHNIITAYTSGKIGAQVVLKQLNGKTLVTKYPDRSRVTLSPLQIKSNAIFRQAVAYAKALINDPVRKAALIKQLKSRKKTANQSPYQAAIQEYMKAHSNPLSASEVEKAALTYQQHFHLTNRQTVAIKVREQNIP